MSKCHWYKVRLNSYVTETQQIQIWTHKIFNSYFRPPPKAKRLVILHFAKKKKKVVIPLCQWDVRFRERITVSYQHTFTVQTLLLQLIFYNLTNFTTLKGCRHCIIVLLRQDGPLAMCQSPLVQLIKVHHWCHHRSYSCLKMTKLIKRCIKNGSDFIGGV